MQMGERIVMLCMAVIWRIRSQQVAARKISDSCTKARLGMVVSGNEVTHCSFFFHHTNALYFLH